MSSIERDFARVNLSAVVEFIPSGGTGELPHQGAQRCGAAFDFTIRPDGAPSRGLNDRYGRGSRGLQEPMAMT